MVKRDTKQAVYSLVEKLMMVYCVDYLVVFGKIQKMSDDFSDQTLRNFKMKDLG